MSNRKTDPEPVAIGLGAELRTYTMSTPCPICRQPTAGGEMLSLHFGRQTRESLCSACFHRAVLWAAKNALVEANMQADHEAGADEGHVARPPGKTAAEYLEEYGGRRCTANCPPGAGCTVAHWCRLSQGHTGAHLWTCQVARLRQAARDVVDAWDGGDTIEPLRKILGERS